MRGSKFPQATRSLQAPRGMNEDECVPLYVWDGTIESADRMNGTPVTVSRWELDDEDRARIADGAPVWLWVYGRGMPPVALETRDPFA